MQYERQLKEIGGSIMIVLPADLCKYLELRPEDTLVIQDEKGKHGPFVSLWKKR